MKKLFLTLITAVIVTGISVPSLASQAYQYGFESGAETVSDFGKSTSNDDPVSPDPMNQNVRRNKDAADLPPPYFYGSGDIPTDTGSPYHDNLPGGSVSNGGGSGMSMLSAGSAGTGVSGGSFGFEGGGAALSGSSAVSLNQPDGIYTSTVANQPDGLLASTSMLADPTYESEVKYFEDGTIGTLEIEKLDKTITVYEGESLENMKRGIGHFTETSIWDGNCVFAGHNRGADAYFGFVKDLAVGDRIKYTTLYGMRTYEVYNKEKIGDTDYSALGWSAENIIGMITCLANEPSYRILVQAREVK